MFFRTKRQFGKSVRLLAAAVCGLIGLILVPQFVLDVYELSVLTMACINIILVTSFRFITGTGNWSFAHISFMGIAAFFTGALTTGANPISFWLVFPAAVLMVGIIALIFSYPCLRTKGLYFFITTVAVGESIRIILIKISNIVGMHGVIYGISRPTLVIPGLGTISSDSSLAYYYLVLVFTIVCLVILYRLERSVAGDKWWSIGLNELLAETVGINITAHKRLVFIVGSCFAGVAGCLFAPFVGVLDPTEFTFTKSLAILLYVIVGGKTTFVGPIIGTFLFTTIDAALLGLREYTPMVYGAILILITLVLPNGVTSLLSKASLWVKQVSGKERVR